MLPYLPMGPMLKLSIVLNSLPSLILVTSRHVTSRHVVDGGYGSGLP